jgi:hypothetical protein
MKIETRDIFEQIGTLFYAVAVEQHIKPLEVAELKLLISRDWLSRNLDQIRSIVSDETHFIMTTMDMLQGADTSAKQAFAQFAKFYVVHPEVFTSELTQRIIDTATEITRIFKADNPLDNASLTALNDLVKRAHVNS